MHDFDAQYDRVGPGHYRTRISGNWSINNTPNGGYIMSLMTRVMGKECGLSAETAIVTANYLDRCSTGTADFLVDTMGVSGSFVRLQARLVQENRERIRAMATFVRPGSIERGGLVHHGADPVALAPETDCVQVPPIPGYSLYTSVDLLLDPSSAGWMENRLSDRAVMKGWIRFKTERSIDLEALTLFADSFPPAAFASRGMVAWVPTIEYSVNVRQVPKTPVVKGIFSSRFISRGLVEEDGQLWDETGNLLAISRQIAKYQPS